MNAAIGLMIASVVVMALIGVIIALWSVVLAWPGRAPRSPRRSRR